MSGGQLGWRGVSAIEEVCGELVCDGFKYDRLRAPQGHRRYK
jgi:hypothetical protein